MMTIQAGDFWVADIPFTDGSGSKKRPVLVLWPDGNDAVVAAVTSAHLAVGLTFGFKNGKRKGCATHPWFDYRGWIVWNRRYFSQSLEQSQKVMQQI